MIPAKKVKTSGQKRCTFEADAMALLHYASLLLVPVLGSMSDNSSAVRQSAAEYK